jgi:hypothetical protein
MTAPAPRPKPRRPDPILVIVGCLLAGLGWRRYSIGAGAVPGLPPGLFSVAIGIALIVLACRRARSAS